MRLKARLYLTLTILLGGITLFSCADKSIKIDSVNGQVALFSSKSNAFSLKENNKKSVLSSNKRIKLMFESSNMNGSENEIIINDHKVSLGDIVDRKNQFTKHSMDILGANIKDGKLKLTIKAGRDSKGKHDKFFIRNVNILIGKDEIWSNEFSKAEYLNVSQSFGADDLKSDYRYGYLSQREYTFDIPREYINSQAVILNDNLESYTVVASDEEVIKNTAYMRLDLNIKDNEVINDTTKLEITTLDNIESLRATMDGMEIPNDLTFNRSSWAPGKHTIRVEATNSYGFKAIKEVKFTLGACEESLGHIAYKMYDPGVNNTLADTISLGKEVKQAKSYDVAFSSVPTLNFVVDAANRSEFIWKGLIPANRTAFMQVYNYKSQSYETLSTAVSAKDGEEVTLGFRLDNKDDYLKGSSLTIRVGNMNHNPKKEVSSRIYHTTDIQYMTQKGILDSIVGEEAHNALTKMANYLIENKDDAYSVMSGDFVQTKKDRDKEWEVLMKYFMDPIIEAGVRLGASSGNHDVGGLRENSVNGSHALDDELYYDKFNQYLGEFKFKNLPYYGGGFMNNRSHYDVINLGGHDFIFLYLGWGSSRRGIHVSELDVDYAKTVLEKYPNTDVVLCTHEYLNALNERTATAEYLFEELVKRYSNVKMVLSGHINGASRKYSRLDDNNDGICDREVHELLFDLQEEDDLYGASYIRSMGLDFSNNQIVVSTYSPWFNDSEVEVLENPEVVKDNLYFNLDFDLSNIGYGMKSYGLM